MKKMLVVYYSWSNGNTKRIAEQLAGETGADLWRIETKEPYRGSYSDVVSQGQDEVERGYMPPIKEMDVDPDDYDIIAVGTPTWWYTMAPAVKTFLHDHSWQGKTVIPFMTNGGWPGHVIRDMKKACAGADFPLSMEVKFDSTGGDAMQTPQSSVDAFVKKAAALLQD